MTTRDTHHAPDSSGDGFVPFRDDDRLMAFIGNIGICRNETGIALQVTVNKGALNPLGILHGGALSSLFDVAMYEAAKQNGEVVTVAQEVKFLAVIRPENPLLIDAVILREGRKTVFCTATAKQGDNICGYATAQFTRLARP